MKFFATLALIGSAVASYEDATYDTHYDEPCYDDYHYEEPTYEHPKTLTRSFATSYNKLDIDHIVAQLSDRNEDRVRMIRDETEMAVSQLKFFHRNAVDARVDAFEDEIAGLRQAWADALAHKRAMLAAANAHMIDEQHHLNDAVVADVDFLNAEHEELIDYILDSDAQYDHTTIVYWLNEDGKSAALTWETFPKVPTKPYETYLSWNAREEGDQQWLDASHVTGYAYGPHDDDYHY